MAFLTATAFLTPCNNNHHQLPGTTYCSFLHGTGRAEREKSTQLFCGSDKGYNDRPKTWKENKEQDKSWLSTFTDYIIYRTMLINCYFTECHQCISEGKGRQKQVTNNKQLQLCSKTILNNKLIPK